MKVDRHFLLYDHSTEREAVEYLLENHIEEIAPSIGYGSLRLIKFKSDATPSDIMSETMGWEGFITITPEQFNYINHDRK